MALKAELSDLSGSERSNVEWILDSADSARELGQ